MKAASVTFTHAAAARRRLAGWFTSVPSVASVAALALASAACGGAAPPPEAPPAPVAKPVERPAPVDLSAVPEPRTLVVQARIARPRQTLAAVAAIAGFPVPSPALIGEALTDVEVGDVLDLSQPVDVAVTFEGTARPDVSWAVSAALAPGEATMAKLRDHFTVTTGQGGVSRLEILKGEDVDTNRRCAIFPAYGPASHRIVCSDSERGVRDLGPYLARTRPRVPAGKDFEIEARGAPMREFLTQGRQMLPAFASAMLGGRRGGIPGLGSILKEVATDAIDFGIDVDSIALDAGLNDAGAEANMRLSLSGSASMIGRFITGRADKAGPPPDAFFKLPGDAESAFFGRGWDDKELARPKEVLFQFTRAMLEKEGFASADSEALERAVSGYMDLATNGWVSASGSDWAQAGAAAKKLADAQRAGKRDAILDAERTALEKLDGWSMWGVESPFASVQANVKDIVSAFNRPTLQKALKTQMHDGVPLPTLKVVPVAAALKLPKDAMHVELSVTRVVDESAISVPPPATAEGGKPRAGKAPAPVAVGKPKVKLAKPVKMHGFVVADGARTWIAWGIDEAQVAARVRSLVTASPAAPASTLETRKGIEKVIARDGKWNGAGFMTARSFARSDAGITALLDSAGRLHLPDEAKLASADWGMTPLLFGSRAEASARSRSLVVNVTVPSELLRDLASLDFGHRRH